MQAHGPRWAATCRGRDVRLLHNTELEQLGDPLSDQGAAEARPSDQLRPGDPAVAADEIDDDSEAVELVAAELGKRVIRANRHRFLPSFRRHSRDLCYMSVDFCRIST